MTYSPRPKLYFVKVDVQACFDTIEQRELLRIIDKLISEVLSYSHQVPHSLTGTTGRIHDPALRVSRNVSWKTKKNLCQASYRWYVILYFSLGYGECALSEDPPHFLQYAVELAQSLRSIIFADEVIVRYRRIS